MSRHRGKEHMFTKTQKRKVIKRQGGRCRGCNEPGHTGNLEPHHIVHVVNGGETKICNCIAVCRPCHIKLHA